jgi:hypothetical protein
MGMLEREVSLRLSPEAAMREVFFLKNFSNTFKSHLKTKMM